MPKITSLKPLNNSKPLACDFGETPLPFAPQISLDGGHCVVPQQYLNVDRNLRNIEAILARIEFADDYILFGHQENGVLGIQVGILGCENYPLNAQQATQTKIVYGRRWLIEPTTPTSEVVQTALLAIKKAREHELRENVFLSNGEHTTTPFNSHMDLPLMQSNPDFFHAANVSPSADNLLSDNASIQQRIQGVLNKVRLKSFTIELGSVRELSHDKYLIELSIHATGERAHFPELANKHLAFVCDNASESVFLHELMNELIKQSDRYIEEQFTFDGFARFSHNVCPEKLAEFSYKTRNIKHKDPRFHKHFRQMSYDVDASKAPFFAHDQLGEIQRDKIERGQVSGGYLPKEPETTSVKKAQSAY